MKIIVVVIIILFACLWTFYFGYRYGKNEIKPNPITKLVEKAIKSPCDDPLPEGFELMYAPSKGYGARFKDGRFLCWELNGQYALSDDNSLFTYPKIVPDSCLMKAVVLQYLGQELKPLEGARFDPIEKELLKPVK